MAVHWVAVKASAPDCYRIHCRQVATALNGERSDAEAAVSESTETARQDNADIVSREI